MKQRNRSIRAMILCPLLIIGLMLISVDTPVASAQVLYGSIVGTVTDQTNAVVPQATVRVTNTSTALSREATTDASGYYSIPNLMQGSYDVSITAPGFKPL
ncbi:MAG: carboxypeptidase-like regulatory domain-containing protein, partial [Bryobacteraceae bacterium]